MKLNCREGDLAIIVRSFSGNEGKIVRCVKYLGVRQLLPPTGGRIPKEVWQIDQTIQTWAGVPIDYMPDANLRPIRDSDEDDESLRWAGLPTKEGETA